MDYSRTIFAPETRIPFVVEALVGLRRYKEALDSFRVLKDLTDKFYNEETRHRTEKNGLELQASRAENEATPLRLKQQRTLLTAIVCGLLLIAGGGLPLVPLYCCGA